jgi:hypothetical protein
MAAERARWRDVREFLDDLPVRHCQVKPPHEYCTICMRINYGIAYDCPLYERPYIAPSRRPTTGGRAAAEPVRASVTTEIAREALRGEEFPVIEFAGPRRPKQAAAPRAKEEDAPLEVEVMEVVPMEGAPAPRAVPPARAAPAPAAHAVPAGTSSHTTPAATDGAASAPPSAAPPAEAPGGPAKPPAAAPKVDPEELMHRIMEELEIPDEEEAPEAEDEDGPGEKADAGVTPEPPATKSRVAEKRIVLRRKKKGG